MVGRKSTYKVPSDEVQGEGSWVELSYLTYDEAHASLSGNEAENDLLEKHVVGWNWVDSKGDPFGPPQDHLGELFYHERWFLLGKLFNPDEEASKNSETG